MFLFVMKKKFKYLVFLMPLLFFSSVNYSVKANNKNTLDKVTVVELEDKDYPTFSLIKKKSRTKTIGKISAFNFDRLNRINRNYKDNRYKPGVSLEANQSIVPLNIGRGGVNGQHHITSLVQSDSRPKKATAKESITSSKPYIAVGRIFSVTNNIATECSGALIGKAVVATSAECIAEFGGAVADEVWFTPAATSNLELGDGPLGMWKAKKLYIPACFTAGNCRNISNSGITLYDNDIALFTLRKKGGRTPFDMGGTYLNYGWNHYGFAYTGIIFRQELFSTIFTTLGYPSGLGDNSRNLGGSMIKTDSIIYLIGSYMGDGEDELMHYMWGSGQPEASGSPAIVNFGFKPTYGDSNYPGRFTRPNVVVGIQSSPLIEGGGYLKRHIANGSIFGQNSSFPNSKYKDKSGRNWGAGNIGLLMRKVCGQGYGKGQSNGICLNR